MPDLCVIYSKDIFREKSNESKGIDCFQSVDPEPQPESSYLLVDADLNLSPKSVKINTAANDFVVCQ
jgi:hypothetical protein